MLTLRPSASRGRFDHGWLDTAHTFSFGEYHDPAHMGFRSLRVLNEDRILPGHGFPTHPHRDMEILTYVLSGGLRHADSSGGGGVIRPGDLQRMSAGTGITHSEANASPTEPVHLLQIWILPERRGLVPGYEQRTFSDAERHGVLRLLASHDGRDGSVTVHQDLGLYGTLLEQGDRVEHTLGDGRHAWVQVAGGEAMLNGRRLSQGDGASLSGEPALTLVADSPAEVLVFDLG